MNFRPIVQLVEHTAHNGECVGSSPTRPSLCCQKLLENSTESMQRGQERSTNQKFFQNQRVLSFHSFIVEKGEWLSG